MSSEKGHLEPTRILPFNSCPIMTGTPESLTNDEVALVGRYLALADKALAIEQLPSKKAA